MLICALIGIASTSTSNPQGGSNYRPVSVSAPPSASTVAKTSMQGENSQSEAEKAESFFDRPSASFTAKEGEDITKTYPRPHVEDSSNKASRDEDVTTSAPGNNKQQGAWLTP